MAHNERKDVHDAVQIIITVGGADGLPDHHDVPGDSQYFVLVDVDEEGAPESSSQAKFEALKWGESFTFISFPTSIIHFCVCYGSAQTQSADSRAVGNASISIADLLLLSQSEEEIPVNIVLHEAASDSDLTPARLLLKIEVLKDDDNGFAEEVNENIRRSRSQCQLSRDLISRFKQSGDIADVEAALDQCTQSLELLSVDDSERSMPLCILADALVVRSQQKGGVNDLNQAVQYAQQSLNLCPVGSARRLASLVSLGTALRYRCQELGTQQDLTDAIAHLEEALALYPKDHPERPVAMSQLGNATLLSYQRTGNVDHLGLSIQYHTELLHSYPPGHPDRSISLNTLAVASTFRFHLSGETDDLDVAIQCHLEALELRPPGHPARSRSLANLALNYSIRFQELGDINDVELGLAYGNEALELRPPGHPGRSSLLNYTGIALMRRFYLSGDINDLDISVAQITEALQLSPPSHPLTTGIRSQLGQVLVLRFDQRGDLTDLHSAIQQIEAVLASCQPGDPKRYVPLVNLALSYRTRFEQLGDTADLDMAIVLMTEASQLCSDRPARSRATAGDILGQILKLRYEQRGDPADLGEAVRLHLASVELIGTGHMYRASLMINLAQVLLSRFALYGRAEDLEIAMDQLNNTIDVLPVGHPHLNLVYHCLAQAYAASYPHSHNISDQAEAFKYYEMATHHETAGLKPRLTSALWWIAYAQEQHHESELCAFQAALALLDRQVMVTPGLVSRHRNNKALVPSTLTTDAAACAIQRGELETAVEILEKGRALSWYQLARFRTPLDSLRASSEGGRALAEKFERYSQLLERGNTSREDVEDTPRGTIEQSAQRYRELASQWNEVVDEIRKMDGFSQFLRPTPYAELQEAASAGPVIMINVNHSRCDALIVTYAGPPHHIRLDVKLEDIQELASRCDVARRNSTTDDNEQECTEFMTQILRSLWDFVVCAVVDELKDIVPLHSRIWWCPTSALIDLPLHGAGPYQDGEANLSQLYISSYTSTLTTLLKSRRQQAEGSSLPTLLAVGQAKPYEGSTEEELPQVSEELELVQQLTSTQMSFTQLSGEEATCDAVLEGLHTHNWIHVACHGAQDTSNPYNSSLAMGDKPLRLLDIIQARLEHSEFAFLSVCYAALGDSEALDEVIHLVAGLQFAGFRSVVGTIGAVDDDVALVMVEEFYKSMMRRGGRFTDAAEALNDSAAAAEKRGVSLYQRLVFVHLGA